MDDLLIKYILKEVTPEQSDQVQQWLTADAANRARFEKLQAVWQLAAQPDWQPVTDASHALHQLKQTLKTRETARHIRNVKRIWTAAAAAVGIAGVALGAYVWMNPNATVKKQQPVIQADTILQKPVHTDTMPAVQAVPALHNDTIPVAKPHKKKMPIHTAPVQPVLRKMKAAQQPTQPMDSTHAKRKHAQPAQTATPVSKHKSLKAPVEPQPSVKKLSDS